MVATERPRLVTEAHLKRNKLVSDLYKTALMTKQLKITFGCISGAIKHPVCNSQAWEDERFLRHLLSVQHIPREGSVLKIPFKALH